MSTSDIRCWAVLCLFALALSGTFTACVKPEPPDGEDRFGEPTRSEVSASIPYREETTALPKHKSAVPIGDLIDNVEQSFEDQRKAAGQERAPVWYGFAQDGYPMGGQPEFDRVCDPGFGNKVYQFGGDEGPLPTTIEGVVTLHPRHYEKVSTCGEDHRYYGSYVLQDKSGSITVLKDSLVADFTYGDRVRIEVRGIVKQFGSMAVLTHETKMIERRTQATNPDDAFVPFKKLEETSFAQVMLPDLPQRCPQGDELFGFGNNYLDIPDNLGNTYRIEGRVCQEPTNQNFNEFTVRSGECPTGDNDSSGRRPEGVEWTVSMGLDLGRLGLDLQQGDRIQVTGPVFGRLGFSPSCGWRFSMQATTIGQIDVLK